MAPDALAGLVFLKPKAALRARGEPGRLLASRLGRLSKARNGVAHRDAGLKLAVAELFRGSGISVEEAGAAMQVEVSGPTQIEKINKVAEQEQGKTVGRCTELEGELLQFKAGHAAEVNEWRANLATAAEALDHLREHCRSSRTNEVNLGRLRLRPGRPLHLNRFFVCAGVGQCSMTRPRLRPQHYCVT